MTKVILASATLVLIMLFTGNARAQLTVEDPTQYGTKPGYIDSTVDIVRPNGAYVEQSLYVWYSDHDQHPGNGKLEIVHRFTLPQGAVVNNMWLWIGDTLVQAKMFSTWTARHIYDSIVVTRHDPAFLAKNGNAYELDVYPLASGQFREARIDFISPTQWIGNSGYAELPLSFWKNNNNPVKPVQVFFKEENDIWGVPSIRELPQLSFGSPVDSGGYVYRKLDIADISGLNSLSLSFKTDFANGLFANATDRGQDTCYFQIGVDPASFKVVNSDTGSRSVIVGLDLSGRSNNSVAGLLPHIEAVLQSALRPVDRFRLVVAGNDSIIHYSSWQNADSTTIDTVLRDFSQTPFAASVSRASKPVVIFCDSHAQTIWDFPSLDSIAIVKQFDNIVDASGSFWQANIVASYDHGYETVGLTNSDTSNLFPIIDSLFARGGRFLGYYDHNREYEGIETHYIHGLTENYEANNITLFARDSSSVGSQFPSSVVESSVNFLNYNDPAVSVEMANRAGDAAVISKKVSNGLLMVSGIWAFEDDGALKQMMAVPLLGVTQSSSSYHQMLEPLLDDIRSSIAQDGVQQVIVFSNADSLIPVDGADSWVNSYLSGIGGTVPVFNTVNLLDGSLYTPPYVTQNGVDYYGSGYLANDLSTTTHGLHLETHVTGWDAIAGELAYSDIPRVDSLEVNVLPDGGTSGLLEMNEVYPQPNDPAKPRFFIGSAVANSKLQFNLVAQFQGFPTPVGKQATSYLAIDTTDHIPVIGEMLGWQHLQNLLQSSPGDTSSIVDMALKYNLLCDYTALIALEPNTTTPGQQPNQNGNGGGSTLVQGSTTRPDSLSIGAYPNPFNPQTTFYVSLPKPASVQIVIYNILGQRVRTFDFDGAAGGNTIVWNGLDSFGRMVSSGVYFADVIITERPGNVTFTRVVKLMMLK